MAGKSQGSILGFFNRTKRKTDDDSESAGPSPKQAAHQPTCVDSGTVTGERNDDAELSAGSSDSGWESESDAYVSD